MRLRNWSDLDFDISRSLKVKYDSVIGLTIYAFLSMFNIWPNSAPLKVKRLQNLTDLEFVLSRSLRSNVMSLDSSYMGSYIHRHK